MTALVIDVVGTPAPQGSKRAIVNRYTGRAAVVESSEKVKPWREAVKHAALDALRARNGGRQNDGTWGHAPTRRPAR